MQTFLRMTAAAAVVALPLGAAATPDAPIHFDLPEARFVDTFTVQDFLDLEIAGGSYTNELAKAYQERAAYEASYGTKGDGNWYDATAFYNKGLLALNGQEVQPWTPDELGVNEEFGARYIDAATIAAARIAYNATLKRVARYKSVKPAECAQLVALYDHWLEQVRETPHYITRPDAVFAGWVAAYKGCFSTEIFFGFPVNHCESTDNDFRISDEPESNLNERSRLEAYAASLGEDEASGLLNLIDAVILVEGHASTTASMLYNRRLGECRSSFAAGLLEAAGVDINRVTTESFGEEDLLVPTPDATEEYRNRRVEIEER